VSNIEIREAKREDCSLILEFIKDLADFEKLSHEVIASAELLEKSLFCDNPEAEVVIATYDDKPAGFALFFFNYSTFLARKGLYLEDLFVKEEFRGTGIGKALLIKLANIAVERGCGRFEWSVLDWNEKAIDFYKALGAKPMDEWTVHRVDGDALIELSKL